MGWVPVTEIHIPIMAIMDTWNVCYAQIPVMVVKLRILMCKWHPMHEHNSKLMYFIMENGVNHL